MNAQTGERLDIGTWIKVRGLVPGAETVVHFVPETQVNYFEHRLPTDSLLGEALIGSEVGDTVHLKALGNDQMELTVLEVGRD